MEEERERDRKTILNMITDAIKVKKLIRFSKTFFVKRMRHIWKDPKLSMERKEIENIVRTHSISRNKDHPWLC